MGKSNENSKLIEKVAKIAAETAIEYLEKEKQKNHKYKNDRRLRNTKLLLRNYRNFKDHIGDVKTELEGLNRLDPNDFFQDNELAIESIKRSKERTLALVRFVDQVLLSYRIKCEESGDPVEERRYKIIYSLYISDEKKSIDEIVACDFLDRSTVFRDINRAVEALSVLIFGIDGLRLK
ncbi:MAG: hypothetical protein AB7V16_08735 [Vulcanibacillus sp.]